MGIFQGVLLVSDLDGTLLNKDRIVSAPNAEALRAFIAQGGRFTVATGRALQAFELPRRGIPMNAPVILANGALIYDYDSQKILHTVPLSEGFMPLCHAVREHFPHVAVEAHLPEGIWLLGANASSRLHGQVIGVEQTLVNAPEEIPAGWLKMLFTAEHDDLVTLRDWLQPQCEGRFDLLFSHPCLLEMQDVRANKGEGVSWLAEHLGVSRIYCCGDYQNDLPMLTRFTSFAPQNAEPGVRAAVGQVGPSCDEHFMAWVVAQLGEEGSGSGVSG